MARTTMLVVLLLFLGLSASADDLETDRAALLALRSAVGRGSIAWDAASTPCSWRGVACRGGRVSTLRLPGAGLAGVIPPSSLGNLTALRVLSLRLNAISGPLPSDLAGAAQLRNVYLQGNRLSGGFPTPLASLPRLVRLNLAENRFSGEIPASLNNLTRLSTLLLEENQFSGALPPLPALSNLRQFNVSFNNLSGPIPPSLRTMPASSFLGMKSLCGGPLGPCPGEISPSPSPAPAPSRPPAMAGKPTINNSSSGSSKLSGGAIAGIAVGSVVGFLILLGLLIFICARRRRNNERKAQSSDAAAVTPASTAGAPPRIMESRDPGKRDSDSVSATPAAVGASAATRGAGEGMRLVFVGGRVGNFDLEDLLRASAEVLGKGTYGTSYKAVLEMGEVVCVKRLKDVSIQGIELRERTEQVGAMEHPNLVPLRAYYYSKDEKLLVNDFMPMGSLSALLHGNKGPGQTMIYWDNRCAIALAVARGVNYIHSLTPNTSHGNIKSSNVLLDQWTDARLSDYILAGFAISSSPSRSGYRAPEVVDSRKASKKADVYSFGVLLLELLTSKAPLHSLVNEGGTDLPRWVQSVAKERWVLEVLDPNMSRDGNMEEDMIRLLQVAMDCVSQHPDQRPPIEVVVSRIEDIRGSQIVNVSNPGRADP